MIVHYVKIEKIKEKHDIRVNSWNLKSKKQRKKIIVNKK